MIPRAVNGNGNGAARARNRRPNGRVAEPRSPRRPVSGTSADAQGKVADESAPTPPEGVTVAAPPGPPCISISEEEFREIVTRANAGDAKAVRKLQRVLDANPRIWQEIGDVARYAEQAFIAAIAKDNVLLAECVQRHLETMRAQLAGPSATPLIRLVVERVVAAWAAAQYADWMVAQADETGTPSPYWVKRQEAAARRFEASVKALRLAMFMTPTAPAAKRKSGTKVQLSSPLRSANGYAAALPGPAVGADEVAEPAACNGHGCNGHASNRTAKVVHRPPTPNRNRIAAALAPVPVDA